MFSNLILFFFLSIAGDISRLARFTVFVVKIYLRQWFNCFSSIEAPLNDLTFLCALKKYRQQDEQVAKEAEIIFKRHRWYLSEIMVGLSFFDERFSVEDRYRMIPALVRRKNERNKINSETIGIDENTHISDFISSETINFFKIIGKEEIKIDFYCENPDKWNENPQYSRLKKVARSLCVVNDPAERAVGLISDFNASATSNEEQKQYLLQVIEKHRRDFPSTSTSSIKEQLKKK